MTEAEIEEFYEEYYPAYGLKKKEDLDWPTAATVTGVEVIVGALGPSSVVRACHAFTRASVTVRFDRSASGLLEVIRICLTSATVNVGSFVHTSAAIPDTWGGSPSTSHLRSHSPSDRTGDRTPSAPWIKYYSLGPPHPPPPAHNY